MFYLKEYELRVGASTEAVAVVKTRRFLILLFQNS